MIKNQSSYTYRIPVEKLSLFKVFIVKKLYLFYLLVYIVLLSTPLVLRLLFPAVPDNQIPPVSIVALWAIPLIVLTRVKNILLHFIADVWIVWFVIGSINVVAALEYYGSYYLLDVKEATFIYILFTFVFVCGIFVFEFTSRSIRNITSNKTHTTAAVFKDINPYFTGLIIIFPFLWFISLYRSLGYIPLLSAIGGTDITSQIYELDYGSLYGFAVINVLAMLIALDKSRTIKKYRWFFILLIIIFGVFSLLSGKRYSIVVFFVAAIIYAFRMMRVSVLKVAILLSILLLLYMGILVVRQGLNSDKYTSLAGKLIITGVEYRMFVYTVNHIDPGEIDNYDWGASTIGSGVNSRILDLFGLVKNELVQMGSAYSWRYIFSTVYGIRSGIISELYMAYGYYGGLILFLFGIVTGWVCDKIYRTRTKMTLISLSIIYGLFVISIVGQTTDTVGTTVVLLYAWIGYFITRFLPRIKIKLRTENNQIISG